MSGTNAAEHMALLAMGGLLAQAGKLHLFAMAALLAALFFLSAAAGPLSASLLAAAFVPAGLESYFAVRVGLDAALFKNLASMMVDGDIDPAAIDAGLLRAGLLKALPAPRALEQRMAGALSLFRRQATAASALAVLAGLAWGLR